MRSTPNQNHKPFIDKDSWEIEEDRASKNERKPYSSFGVLGVIDHLMAAAKEPSSSSTRSNVYHHGSDDKALTDSDLAAAQQLLQLSDDDNNNSSSGCHRKRRRSYKGEEYETDEEGVEYQGPLSVITWAKIEEIFGKEDEQEFRTKKKTKLRLLADIYLTTKPIRT